MSHMALPLSRQSGLKVRPAKRIGRGRVVVGRFHAADDVTTTYANIFKNPSSIVRGLPVKLVHPLAASIGLGAEELAKRIGVSRSSFHRWARKPDTALSAQASDALARFGILMAKAMETFEGDEAAARQWLSSQQPGLGNAVPLELAQTTPGFREVEKLLTRIDLGVYA